MLLPAQGRVSWARSRSAWVWAGSPRVLSLPWAIASTLLNRPISPSTALQPHGGIGAVISGLHIGDRFRDLLGERAGAGPIFPPLPPDGRLFQLLLEEEGLEMAAERVKASFAPGANPCTSGRTWARRRSRSFFRSMSVCSAFCRSRSASSWALSHRPGIPAPGPGFPPNPPTPYQVRISSPLLPG